MTQNKLVTTLNSAIITLLLGWMFIFLDFIFACVTAILNKIFLSSKFSADIFLVPFASTHKTAIKSAFCRFCFDFFPLSKCENSKMNYWKLHFFVHGLQYACTKSYLQYFIQATTLSQNHGFSIEKQHPIFIVSWNFFILLIAEKKTHFSVNSHENCQSRNNWHRKNWKLNNFAMQYFFSLSQKSQKISSIKILFWKHDIKTHRDIWQSILRMKKIVDTSGDVP